MPHWCANAHMLICDVCLTANSPLKETRHFSVSFNRSAESANIADDAPVCGTPPDNADDVLMYDRRPETSAFTVRILRCAFRVSS